MTDALAYHTFVTDRFRAHPGPLAAAITWALDRDKQTRQAAASLQSEGYPMSEALQVAVEQKTAVLWQIIDGDGPPTKRLKTVHGEQVDPSTQQPLTEHNVCHKWNVAKRQRDCPVQKFHRCSFRMENGQFCGAWQHSKAKHKTTKTK